MGAYCDQRPFSIDLIGAVRASLGAVLSLWNIPSPGATSRFFCQKDLRSGLDLLYVFRETRRCSRLAPCHCPIPRVRKDHILDPKNFLPRTSRFLDLISSSQHMLVVPTLDVDLVWHSHQLSPARYHKDCRTNVGRYVDQWVFFLPNAGVSDSPISDDKVEQFHLSDAFDATCRAWEVGLSIHPLLHPSDPHACRSGMVSLIPNVAVHYLETQSGRSSRGWFPSQVQNIIRWLG